MKKVDYQFQVTFWNENNDLSKTIDISTEYPNKVDVCNTVEHFYRNLLNVTIHKFVSFSFIFLLIFVPIITCCTMICKGLLLFKLR